MTSGKLPPAGLHQPLPSTYQQQYCAHVSRGITYADIYTRAYVCETCEHEWTETR